LKNIFIPKISENNIINVNVAKATKVLRSVSVLVNFCIQMTKKKACATGTKVFFVGLAYQGKSIVFRFIIEYSSSFRDFGP
jgi:hypothetical protein